MNIQHTYTAIEYILLKGNKEINIKLKVFDNDNSNFFIKKIEKKITMKLKLKTKHKIVLAQLMSI